METEFQRVYLRLRGHQAQVTLYVNTRRSQLAPETEDAWVPPCRPTVMNFIVLQRMEMNFERLLICRLRFRVIKLSGQNVDSRGYGPKSQLKLGNRLTGSYYQQPLHSRDADYK